MPQAAAPPQPRVVCNSQNFRQVGLHQCPSERKGEGGPGSQPARPLLTSPATRRPPPKCGAFRLQPQGSLLRQTGCWRKTDSNLWSHFQKGQRFRARHSVSRSTAPATGVLNLRKRRFRVPGS